MKRRKFLGGLAALGAGIPLGFGGRTSAVTGAASANSQNTYDVAVIGGGVFGAWTAWHLRRAGQRVILIDAYGPGNSRSSSGGESRIIRMGYGPQEFYTRWSKRSLEQWKELSTRERVPLFHPTGVLWLAPESDRFATKTISTLERVGVQFEKLDRAQLEKRYPQISYEGLGLGIFEPGSGALMARRAVQTVVAAAVADGLVFREARVESPAGNGRIDSVRSNQAGTIRANKFVFACGPWMGKVFPKLLGDRIIATRQEIFFFGVPAGDTQFTPPAMPTWIIDNEDAFGTPDIEGRGFKVAVDKHGPVVDPDTQSRVVTPEVTAEIRAYVARRFPALKDAPITETRVCQYEYTSSGDFLVDRHPDFENVWLVGGGSGHGFKHGPAMGEYVTGWLLHGGPVEERFQLAKKEKVEHPGMFE